MQGDPPIPAHDSAPLITEVRIQLTKEPPILAFVSVTLWGRFVVHDLRVLERRDGSRVVLMPRVKGTDGSWSAVAHPVNETARRQIEAAVFFAFEKSSPERASGSVRLAPPIRAAG